ncbi:MAG TPA: cupin domain-containing protein [Desulfonatronum sp.]|nr:cupin domain-containing protein [Desulfonatronum sp.]
MNKTKEKRFGVRRPNPREYFFQEGCFITEWWNSSEDNAVSVSKARVLPRETTRLHRLKGTVERYIILEGQGRVQVGQLSPKDVASGDVVHIPAGVNQKITNTGTVDLVFLAVCTPRFRPDAYEDLEGTLPA